MKTKQINGHWRRRIEMLGQIDIYDIFKNSKYYSYAELIGMEKLGPQNQYSFFFNNL